MKRSVVPGNEKLTGNNSSKIENFQEPVEVMETLATTAGNKKNSTGVAGITVVDMWNQQRNRRLASDMIRRWNLN